MNAADIPADERASPGDWAALAATCLGIAVTCILLFLGYLP